METGLPTRSIMKYNFLVNPFTFVKLTSSFLTIHYNAGHTYRMQEMVKEVTLKNHSSNGLAILHAFSLGGILKYISPFSSNAYQFIIIQVTATKSVHIIIQELMN